MSDTARETSDLILGGIPLVGLLCTLTLAGPDDPRVVRGTASLQRHGALTTITVSNNAILHYKRFNIATPETVRFIQPGVDSRVLNRITGGSPTRIDGTLLANGSVYLVNPAGVVFGKNSVVNVGSMIAGAGNLSDHDFVSGVDRFSNLVGEVRNEGRISGSRVVLVGNQVVNLGSIVAPEGMVAMVAGDEVYLGREGSRMYAKIGSNPRSSTPSGGVRNDGEVNASGGRAVLAAGDMFSLALGTGSTITASNVQVAGGHGGLVTVSGAIDASASEAGMRGGQVEITGDRVGVFGASIDASGWAGGGEILVGGDYQGTGDTPTATRTFVDEGAVLRADAGDIGDGGKIIVWSDETTGFYGEISARGGASGGDGGFAEVSGKWTLDARGDIDLGAPRGRIGTLLYDPAAIVIVGGRADGSDSEPRQNELTGQDNVPEKLGQVRFGDLGDGSGEPFEIHQSEIEGTAANIVLEAKNSITVSGAFDQNELLLKLNSDLTLRTRNNSADGDLAGKIDLINGTNLQVIRTQGTGSISIEAGWDGGPGDLAAHITLPSLVTDTGSISVLAGSTAPSSITIEGELIAGGGVTLRGPVVNLNANISTAGGHVLFQHATAQNILVGDTVTIDTDAAGGSTDAGNIEFQAADTNLDEAPASTGTLELDATADGGGTGGSITLRRVGQSTPLASLVASAGPNTINLNGNVTADSVTFNDAVSLNADAIVVTGTTAVTFTSTVDADDATTNNRTLTVNAGTGTATFGGAIGASQALADFDVTASAISLGGNVTVDDQGANTVTLTGPVTLAANVDVDTDGGTDNNVVFSGAVNADDASANDRTLTVTSGAGTASFGGAIGGTQALADFDVSASAISLGGNVTVDDQGGNTVTLTGAVTLAANVAIDTNGATDNSVIITGVVNADDASVNNRTLTVNADTGTATFGSAIGGTQALADFDVTASAISFGGNVKVDDQGGNTVLLTGPVTLAASVAIDTDGAADNSVVFTGAVNADDAVANNRTLTVNAGTGSATFGSEIGGVHALADFDVTAAAIILGGNVTVDDQGANTVTLIGPVTLASNVTIDTDGAADNSVVISGTVNADDAVANNRTLTVNTGTETATFGDAIGASQALADFDVTALAISLGGNVTVDDQGGNTVTLIGPVTLASHVVIDTNGATDNSVVFTDTVNADDAGANNRRLTVIAGTGTATFGDAIGASQALADFDVTASEISLGGNVTADDQGGNTVTLTGPVTLGANVVIDTDGATDKNVVFTGIVNADNAGANDRTLTVNAGTATATFGGEIGGSHALADFDVTASAISLGGNVTVDDQGGNTVTLTGPVTLTGNVEVDTNGVTDNSVVITGAVNADNADLNNRRLTVNTGTGTATFGGAIGGTQALADFDVTASEISLGGNITADDQGGNTVRLTGPVTLTGNVIIDTDGDSDNSVVILGTVNADDATANNRTLAVRAGSGSATFGSAIGGSQALADFDVTAFSISLGGNITADDQGGRTVTLAGPVTLAANVEIDTDGTVDNSVVISGTVNADNSGANNRTLTVNAGTGTATFGSALGGTQALADFDVAASAISLGGNVKVDDQGGNTVTLTGPVTLTGNVAIDTNGATDNSVVFTDIVDADDSDANNRKLTVNSGTGTVTFGDAIGTSRALADFDVTASAISLGGNVRVDDQGGNTVTFSGPVTLAANVVVDTNGASDNSVVFTGVVNADDATTSNRTLTVNAGTGTATFGDAIGGTQALADFDVSASAISLGGNVTVDDQGGNTVTLAGPVTLAANVVVDTNGATDNNVVFTGTVNADNAGANNRTLTVNAGTGTATFGDAIGGTQALADFDVSASAISLGGNVTVDDQGGNTVTMTGPVTLAGNVVIDTDGGTDNSVVFTDTVNADDAGANNRRLTVNAGTGSATFGGAVGASQALADFDVTASVISFGGNVKVDDQGGNTVTLTGPITLAANVTIDTDGAADNSVVITGAVNADDAGANNRTLTVNAGTGTATFGSALGGSQALADFDVTASTISLGGNVTVDDQGANTVTLTGPVTLTRNVNFDLDGATDNALVLASAVNGDGVAPRNLTVSGSTLTIAGRVGGTVPLGTITTNLPTTIRGDVAAGTVRFNNTLAIAGNGERVITATDADTAVFGTVTLASSVSGLRIRAEEIDFGGNVSPAGGVDQTLKLESFTNPIVLNGTASAGQLDLLQIELDRIQPGFTSVTIGRSDSVSGVRIASAGVDFTAFDTIIAVGPNQSIAVGGDIDTVGNDLTMTAGNGGQLRLGSDIRTRGGDVSLSGIADIDLVGNSIIDTDQSGGALDAGDIAFAQSGTIDGAFDLSVSADADGGGAGGAVVLAQVGTQTALDDLIVKGNSVTLPGIGAGAAAGVSGLTDIEATGGLVFSGTEYVTNGANYSASSVTVSGPAGQSSRFVASDDTITFAAFGGGNGALTIAEDVDVVIDAGSGGAVVIEGPLNATAGGQRENVTITAGGTRLSGDVGTSAAVGSLQINGNLRVAEGLAVDLRALGDIGVSGGVFGTASGSAESLTFNPGGATTIGGGIFGRSDGTASGTGLTTVVANGPLNLTGDVRITGGSLTTNGLLTVQSASILSAGSGTLTIESAQLLGATTLEAAEIDFGNGPIAGAFALQLQPNLDSAAINIGSAGDAGNATALDLSRADLAALADGFSSITIGRAAGSHAIVMGDSSLSDPLTVQATGAGGTVTVAGAVVGTGDASVTLRGSGLGTALQQGGSISTSGGDIVLDDNVLIAAGASVPLGSGGGDITLQRAITLGDGSALSVVTGGGDATLAADGSGVNGVGDLSVNAGTGATSLAGPIGGTTPLSGIEVIGGSVLLPSAITTSGDQSYRGRVVASGSFTSTTGGIRFDESLVLPNDLSITTNGDVLMNASVDDTGANRSGLTLDAGGVGTITFGSTVGATSPIGTLAINNATSVTAANSISARNIATSGITGEVAFGPLVTDGTVGGIGPFAIDLEAGSFQLPGPFTTFGNTGLRINITGGGAATIGSAADTWDGLGGNFRQVGSAGVVRIGRDVAHADGSALSGSFSLDGVLELANGSRVVSAQNVTLGSGFRSTSGQRGLADLTLRAVDAGVVTIDGKSTGDDNGTLVRTLTVEGASRIQGTIGTTNGIRYDGAVDLTGPARVRVAEAGSILFGGSITSANASSLTVQVDPTRTANTNVVEDGNVILGTFDGDVLFPTIEFGGDIGTSQNPLGSLSLNPIAHDSISGLPTIISRDVAGMSVFVQNGFEMGVGEKLTTVGPLSISSTIGDITLGDLTVAGDLSLSTPARINLLSRSSGPLIGYGKFSGERAVEGDGGGDLVLLGTATITGDVRVVNSGGGRRYTVSSGTIGNVGAFAGVGSVSLRQFGEAEDSLDRGDFWTSGDRRRFSEVLGDPPPNSLFLDLRASGPVVQDVASALAGAIPRDPETGHTVQETRLSAAQLDKLVLMNINAIQRDGIRLAPGGPRVYNDIGEVNKFHQVSVNRMSSTAVDRVLDQFDQVFWRGEGAERAFSKDIVRREIERAVQPYLEENQDVAFDAEALWSSLITGTPEQVSAAETLFGVQLLLQEIRQLGLTDAEAELPHSKIIGYLYSEKVVFANRAELGALVEAARPVDGSAAPNPGTSSATDILEEASQP